MGECSEDLLHFVMFLGVGLRDHKWEPCDHIEGSLMCTFPTSNSVCDWVRQYSSDPKWTAEYLSYANDYVPCRHALRKEIVLTVRDKLI